MVRRLLWVNVLLWAIPSIFYASYEGLIIRYLGLHYVFSPYFLPHQFVSYMFLHGGLWHIFGNMFALLIFGSLLERVWGSRRFLFFYLVTGIGTGLLYGSVQVIEMGYLTRAVARYEAQPDPEEFNRFLLKYDKNTRAAYIEYIEDFALYPDNAYYITQSKALVREIYTRRANIPTIGASGAIFGILMAFAMLFPNMRLFLLFLPVAIKAKYLVLFYGLYELYSEWSRIYGNSSGDNVAHAAHLGGMLIGFLLVRHWSKNRKHFY